MMRTFRFDMTSRLLISRFTIAAGVAYVTGARLSNPAQQPAAKETRLEQVKRTGVIRCGYIALPPYVMKDPNTGKFTGAIVDIIEEMGRQLNLKIAWAGETSYGQMLADLAFNRYDMACGAVYENPSRAREADFTDPLFFSPATMYVRQDDNRFDNHYERANDPAIKFIHVEGMYTALVADEEFPAATKDTLPQLTNGVEQFVAVAAKKADAVVADPLAFANYSANNPNVIRAVLGKPLRVTAMALPLPVNEPSFKAAINNTLAYLQTSGFVDKTLKKYEASVKFIRVAKPYQEESQKP